MHGSSDSSFGPHVLFVLELQALGHPMRSLYERPQQKLEKGFGFGSTCQVCQPNRQGARVQLQFLSAAYYLP
jgi:hypothetical protein